MPRRKPSPEENDAINKNIAAMIEDLQTAGFKPDAVLAFIAFDGWDYNLSIMLNTEHEDLANAEEVMNALTRYVHDELGKQIETSGTEHRAADLPHGGRVEGIVMDQAVTESMGWRQRLESVRKIPREGAKETIAISMKMLDDVISALDHIAKLETGIQECEGDGGCRATKFVEEEKAQRPLVN